MNDYQRGLLKAAEICERISEEVTYQRNSQEAADKCADAIRAEAEKAAGCAPEIKPSQFDDLPLRWKVPADYQEAIEMLRRARRDLEAKSAPDEALIEEVANSAQSRWIYGNEKFVVNAVEWAIREYLRREGK